MLHEELSVLGDEAENGYNHGVIDKGVRADGDKERFNYILSYL